MERRIIPAAYIAEVRRTISMSIGEKRNALPLVKKSREKRMVVQVKRVRPVVIDRY